MMIHNTQRLPQCYRPEYHFTPPSGWMNDPNGLIFYKGKYHLFYQHNPHSNKWGPMHWGHAVTDDFIHWDDLEIALEPQGERTDCYSGSAVYDVHNTSGLFQSEEGGLVLIYTCRTDGIQEQGLAYSEDGIHFKVYEENPVIKNPGCPDFRDPKVFWMEETQCWHMVLAKKETLEFYRSPNLLSWEKTGDWGEGYGYRAGVFECPDLFPIQAGHGVRKWVLMAGDFKLSRTQYFIGEFDGKEFICDEGYQNGEILDYGYDNYSGNTFSEVPDGRRIFIGWMNSTLLWNCTPTGEWRGANTIPREITASKKNGKYILQFSPVKELASVDGMVVKGSGYLIDGASPVLAEGRCLDIRMTLRNKTASDCAVLLALMGNEYVKTGIDFMKKRAYIDRSRTWKLDFAKNAKLYLPRAEAPVDTDQNEIELRILLDCCSVELFVNNGEQVITSLFYTENLGNQLYLECDGDIFVDYEVKVLK